jgi:hypothetical protein
MNWIKLTDKHGSALVSVQRALILKFDLDLVGHFFRSAAC